MGHKVDIGQYTSYRMSAERILSGVYTSALAADPQLAMFITSYFVHSYLEGRTPTECAMRIKESFPLREQP